MFQKTFGGGGGDSEWTRYTGQQLRFFWSFSFSSYCMASPHHSVYPPPPFLPGGEEVEPPTKFLKRGALTGPQLLEGGQWERGGDFLKRW